MFRVSFTKRLLITNFIVVSWQERRFFHRRLKNHPHLWLHGTPHTMPMFQACQPRYAVIFVKSVAVHHATMRYTFQYNPSAEVMGTVIMFYRVFLLLQNRTIIYSVHV